MPSTRQILVITPIEPIEPAGRVEEAITLPTAGRYRVVVDAYPNVSGVLRNFQLGGTALHDDADTRRVTVLTDDERPLVFYGDKTRQRSDESPKLPSGWPN